MLAQDIGTDIGTTRHSEDIIASDACSLVEAYIAIN